MQDIQAFTVHVVQLIVDDWILIILAMILGPILNYCRLWINGKEKPLKLKRKQYFVLYAFLFGLASLCLIAAVDSIKTAVASGYRSPGYPRIYSTVTYFGSGKNNNNVTLMYVGLELVNGQNWPTTFRNWELTATLPNKEIVKAKILYIPDAHDPVSLINDDGSTYHTLNPTNDIIALTKSTPLMAGGVVEGHAKFAFPDVDAESIRSIGTSFVISFMDAYGRTYSNSFAWGAKSGPTMGKAPPYLK